MENSVFRKGSNMMRGYYKKVLVFGIIFLFLGTSTVSGIIINNHKKDSESKSYEDSYITTAPSIEWTMGITDFGEVIVGKDVTHMFLLENMGDTQAIGFIYLSTLGDEWIITEGIDFDIPPYDESRPTINDHWVSVKFQPEYPNRDYTTKLMAYEYIFEQYDMLLLHGKSISKARNLINQNTQLIQCLQNHQDLFPILQILLQRLGQ